MGRGCMEILCVETNRFFESLTSAAKAHQVTPMAIRQAIVNKGKCKGYHFLYNATPAANARNIDLLMNDTNEVKAETDNQVRDYQREIEKRQQQIEKCQKEIEENHYEIKELKSSILTELFKSWYNSGHTIDECAEISGYSKQYLYQKFRAMKIERGLD